MIQSQFNPKTNTVESPNRLLDFQGYYSQEGSQLNTKNNIVESLKRLLDLQWDDSQEANSTLRPLSHGVEIIQVDPPAQWGTQSISIQLSSNPFRWTDGEHIPIHLFLADLTGLD